MAVAEIIRATAVAIISAIAKGNIGLAAIAGAIGAVQLAKVLATPIPKFAKGTSNSPEGPAIVGEQGTEAIISPSGEVSLTPNTATLTYLKKGSQVITADKVDEYLMNNAVRKVALPGKIDEHNYSEAMTKAITSELKRIGGIIENKQETHITLKNGEWHKAVKRGHQFIEWKNKHIL